MRVAALSLENFSTYTGLDLAVERGLTLIVGDNGAGKSTVLEAVCWALYGETIRGADVTGKVDAKFVVVSETYTAKRKREGKTTTLELWRKQEFAAPENISGQTVTETQRKIDALVGPWERFGPTRIFAREFLAKFGAATDKERKQLLEGVLGLDRFDRALALCREDAVKARDTQVRAESRLASVGEQLYHAHERVAQLPEPKPTRPLDVVEKELAAVQAQGAGFTEKIVKLRKMMDGLGLPLRDVQQRTANAKAEATHAVNQIHKLESAIDLADTCPTCLRPMAEADKAGVLAHREREVVALKAKRDAVMLVAEACMAEGQEIWEENKALADEAERLTATRANLPTADLAVELAETRALHAARLREKERAEADVKRLTADTEAAQDAVDAATGETNILACVDKVMGLRGARNLLLGRALIRLQEGANRVLEQLGLGIAVAISGTTKQKSGKEVDAIGIAVMGAGAGDYRALSSGERSRVDVALLLSLADVAGGQGFLAFDEVFDALDQDGQERVAAYLAKLGETRQVVVISHHQDLRSQFPRGSVLRAVKGEDGSRLEVA